MVGGWVDLCIPSVFGRWKKRGLVMVCLWVCRFCFLASGGFLGSRVAPSGLEGESLFCRNFFLRHILRGEGGSMGSEPFGLDWVDNYT